METMKALEKLLVLDIDYPDEFVQETSLATMMTECNGFEKVTARESHPDEVVQEKARELLEKFSVPDEQMSEIP